eukprot:COSAG04_NODE_12063_length_673_cov_0.592334_2_plen_31_part_01
MLVMESKDPALWSETSNIAQLARADLSRSGF